jgi:hypothetical protein
MAINEVLRGQLGQFPRLLGQFDQGLQVHQATIHCVRTKENLIRTIGRFEYE